MTSLTTQITRLLKKEAVWRFVGFFSAIVALLCYALGSSFHYMFGEWNLLKVFLYSLFSLSICLCCLYPDVWRFLFFSDLIKANAAFLVMSITALFSYYAEKLGKGKPDAYSLISCVAFAVMSFSLSRQTQWGFEMELFNSFLTCLIVLLMDIKEPLILVGVVFGCAFISFRRYLDKPSYELGVRDEDPVVIDVNMQQVMSCIRELEQGNSYVTNLLMGHTRKYRRLGGKCELPAMDPNFVIDALPLGKINDLEETIKLMLGDGDGFEEQCREEYCNWRRGCLEQCLLHLFGLQEITINTAVKERSQFELVCIIVGGWSKAVMVALKIIFPSERRLCDRVFSGFHSVADHCFTEVCGGATVQLLNSAYEVGSSLEWHFPLSEILDMHETLRDLIPEFQLLFPESLGKAAMTVHDKLGERCIDIFMQMEDYVFRNPFVNVIVRPDATDHPMTRYVMDYLEKALKNFLKFADGTGKSSSFSDQVDRIMKRLEREVVGWSKNYKYPALRHLFIMNNWRYIERMVTKMGLDPVFVRKSTTIVEQNRKLYQRSSWDMVLDILKPDEGELVEAESIKYRLIKDFNRSICSCQDKWLARKDLQNQQKFIIPIVDGDQIIVNMEEIELKLEQLKLEQQLKLKSEQLMLLKLELEPEQLEKLKLKLEPMLLKLEPEQLEKLKLKPELLELLKLMLELEPLMLSELLKLELRLEELEIVPRVAQKLQKIRGKGAKATLTRLQLL